jgi:hypothetical protein
VAVGAVRDLAGNPNPSSAAFTVTVVFEIDCLAHRQQPNTTSSSSSSGSRSSGDGGRGSGGSDGEVGGSGVYVIAPVANDDGGRYAPFYY